MATPSANKKFFGQFLVENGYITEELLQQAIAYQNQRNLSIGELAIRERLLTREHLNYILTLQKQSSKRFGEIAVEERLLTQSAVEYLLKVQKREHVFIGEALTTTNVLSGDKVDKALHEYIREGRLLEMAATQLPDTSARKQELEIFVEASHKTLLRLCKVFVKKGPWAFSAPAKFGEITALVQLTGPFPCAFWLSAPRSFAQYGAETYTSSPDLSKEGALVEDSFAEIVRITAGTVLTSFNLEQQADGALQGAVATPHLQINALGAWKDHFSFSLYTPKGELQGGVCY